MTVDYVNVHNQTSQLCTCISLWMTRKSQQRENELGLVDSIDNSHAPFIKKKSAEVKDMLLT